MVQMEKFNGKKYCGAKSNENFLSVKQAVNGYCSTGTRACGKLCIKNEEPCPISSVTLQRTNPSNSTTNVKNKVLLDRDMELIFNTENMDYPLIQLNLEIDRPCMQSMFFSSGLANQDSSIYQIYEHNYLYEPYVPAKDNTSYTDTEVYHNKCPIDVSNGRFFDPRFTEVTNPNLRLPFNLFEIKEQNGVN